MRHALKPGVRPTSRRSAAVGLMGIALVTVSMLSAISAQAAVDPFYQRLYEDGVRYAERGDLDGAVELLQLACFGMLEDPPRLGACLVHLALVLDGLDDSERFLGVIDRLVEAERLADAWSSLSLDEATRARLEAAMVRRVPDDRLAGLAGFAGVVLGQRADEVRALPLDERRRVLDRELALAPESLVWRQLWAELELESGQNEAAVRAAEAVLRARPDHAEARCVRGRALSARESCGATVLDDLALCPDPVGAVPRLRCLIVRRDWSRAETLLESLPAAQRESEAVRALDRRLRRERRTAPSAPVTDALQEPSTPGIDVPSADSTSGDSSSGGSSSAAGDVEIDAAWSALESGRSDEFVDHYQALVPIAERRVRSADAQLVTALLAFSLERWDDAVTYFERAERLGIDRADTLFRYAVALFQVGRREQANEILDRCLPQIRPSPYVKFWSQRIRESAG